MRNLHFVLLLFLVLASCSKNAPKWNSTNGVNVVIDNQQDMYMKILMQIVDGQGFSEASKKIDVDDDGINDFEFSSTLVGALGMGYHPMVYVRSLHDKAALYMPNRNDTTFASDTVRIIDTGSEVLVYDETTYACMPVTSSYQISSIQTTPSVKRVYPESTLMNSSDFIAEQSLQSLLDYSWTYVYLDTSYLDSSFYNVEINYINCSNAFPKDTDLFLGIRIEQSGNQKLGWIKFKIFDERSVIIIESAVHE